MVMEETCHPPSAESPFGLGSQLLPLRGLDLNMRVLTLLFPPALDLVPKLQQFFHYGPVEVLPLDFASKVHGEAVVSLVGEVIGFDICLARSPPESENQPM